MHEELLKFPVTAQHMTTVLRFRVIHERNLLEFLRR